MTIFDQTSLDKQIHEALVAAKVPAGDDNAFVLLGTTGGGVRGVLAVKVNNIWEVDTVLAWQKGQTLEGGFAVKASWKN